MVCTCSSSGSTEKSEKIQFGPLYSKYKSGDLSLHHTYSRERSLIPQYVNECCKYVQADFTENIHWRACAILLGVWFLYTGVLYAIFFMLRNKQPIKIRDIRMVSVFMFMLLIQSVFLNIAVMTGGSHNKYDSAIGSFAFILYLYFHLMRAARLLFIYKWHEAKAYSAASKEWFLKFRFVLEFRFYVGAAFALLVLIIIPICLVTYLESPAFSGDGLTVYTTVRCEWWHIPEVYTKNTTNSAMCGCIRAAFLKEGNLINECTDGFLTTCTSASYNQTITEKELCEVCLADRKSSACSTAFVDFYASGACGFPSRTPDFNTCTGGLFGDRILGYTFAAINYFFLAVNLLVLIPIMFKRDFFGLVVENLLMIGFTCPTLSLVFLAQTFKADLGNWWPYPNTSVSFLVGNISSYCASTVTLGYPIALYYFYWRKSFRTSSNVNRSRSKEKQNTSDGIILPSIRPPSLDSPPSPSGSPRHESMKLALTDSDEAALQQCIASATLYQVYLKFTVDEFTTENVVFLRQCHTVFQNMGDQLDTVHLTAELLDICDKFIRAEAVMEVNISSKLRESVIGSVNALDSTAWNVSNSMKARPQSIQEDAQEKAFNSLRVAYREVIVLMARSSWPRFQQSRYYHEYEALQKRETKVERTVLKWLSPSPSYTNDTFEFENTPDVLDDGNVHGTGTSVV